MGYMYALDRHSIENNTILKFTAMISSEPTQINSKASQTFTQSIIIDKIWHLFSALCCAFWLQCGARCLAAVHTCHFWKVCKVGGAEKCVTCAITNVPQFTLEPISAKSPVLTELGGSCPSTVVNVSAPKSLNYAMLFGEYFIFYPGNLTKLAILLHWGALFTSTQEEFYQ